MPTPVTHLYAQGAQFKQLWAHTLDPIASDRYAVSGIQAGEALTAARSHSQADLLLKLAELQEWIDEDITEPAKALLRSIIADIEYLMDGSGPAEAEPAPVSNPPRPHPSHDGAAAPVPAPEPQPEPHPSRKEPGLRVAATVATVKVDKRMRAVVVDGNIYPSIIMAAQSTGRSIAELRNCRSPV